MSRRVFAAHANPAIDPALCRQSDVRARAIVEEGRGFWLDSADPKSAVQLFASKYPDWRRALNSPALIVGRNSCRRIEHEDGDVTYKISHFRYPVPACGARGRNTPIAKINYEPQQAIASSAQ